MTEAERKELKANSEKMNTLVTDIAILKHSNEKIVEPTLKSINEKLGSLSFYTKKEVDDKIRALQKKRWYENTIAAAFSALLTTTIIYIVNKLMDGGQ